MKIYNLILLNFYFLQLISLLSGMHPGEGPSGSQPVGMHPGEGSGSQPGGMHPGEASGSQPGGMYPGEGSRTQQPVEDDEFTQLKKLIFPLLETVGDNNKLQQIAPREIFDTDRVEEINNVRKQYFNLVNAYIELLANTNAIDEHKNSWLKYLYQNMNNPNFTQEQHEEVTKMINELENSRQINEYLKNGLTTDMRALNGYVQMIYNHPTLNLAFGTIGQGQHGQSQPAQSYRGRGQRGQGQRGRGRRGGRRGYGPGN